VNPHARPVEDTRTPEELLDIIEAKGKEVAAAIAELRALTAKARAEDAAQLPDEQAANAAEKRRVP